MTWAKYGNEFFDQLFDVEFPDGLEDACALTHTQALHYLYSVEEMGMTFPRSALRRFASSRQHEAAAAALVAAGLWSEQGSRYQVHHHEDVFRQSLAAQLTKRERDKKHQRRKRGGPVGRGVGNSVANDVANDNYSDNGDDVGATQSVSQSFRQASMNERTKHDDGAPSRPYDPWRDSMPADLRCSVEGCRSPVTPYSLRTFGQVCPAHGEQQAGGGGGHV